jgi:hypothetical protein
MLIVKEWQGKQLKSNKKREIIEKNHKELIYYTYIKGYSVKIIPFLFGKIEYFSYI